MKNLILDFSSLYLITTVYQNSFSSFISNIYICCIFYRDLRYNIRVSYHKVTN